MTSRDFCYWLQGYLEIQNAHIAPRVAPLSTDQVQMIKNHLALVFVHEIDPQHAQTVPASIAQLIHDGLPTIGGADSQGNIYRC